MRLVIRKVQFAPEKPGPQPSAETTRHFLMSDRLLHLEASLDKEVSREDDRGALQGRPDLGVWKPQTADVFRAASAGRGVAVGLAAGMGWGAEPRVWQGASKDT